MFCKKTRTKKETIKADPQEIQILEVINKNFKMNYG